MSGDKRVRGVRSDSFDRAPSTGNNPVRPRPRPVTPAITRGNNPIRPKPKNPGV
jgi:hypothetical protein